MVKVSKGPFYFGLHDSVVNLNYDYYIGKYEITNEQYYRFILSGLRSKKLFIKNGILKTYFLGNEIIKPDTFTVKIWDNRIYLENDSLILNQKYTNHPVTSVTWFGVNVFCEYYGFEIPNQAEWEKAAKGNKKWWFPWGNEIDSSFANYYNSNDPFEPGTTPVGFYNGENHNGFQTSKAESFFGCYDMAGNAWEWTSDRFTEYSPYNLGKGGGFNIHFPAHLQIYYVSTFDMLMKQHPPLDICHLSDGFRVIKRE